MFEKVQLITPSTAYVEQILSYRQELLDNGSSMDGCGSLRCLENPNEWLEQVDSLSCTDTVPSNWVQSTQFICIRELEDKLVGMIQIRHYFNEFLEHFGGHIGYSVRPSERKKGYASKMLHDCLPYCKKIGLNKILITCLDDNEGSRKAILANTGKYESTVFEPEEKVYLERYWITL